MAISWGSMETSGGNGMRVGLEVTWDSVSHSDSSATATIKIYTDNQFTYNDNQTLTYGGHISGSTNFLNNDGDTAVLRATKTYTYNYGSSSYGSSPGTRTFSAALSGAFNGVTPSHSVNVNIPARPYAAPLDPTSANASRINDASTQVSWVNNSTAGRPWSNVHLRASVNGGGYFYITSSISGAASSYTVSTAANQKLRFSVAAVGPAGSSGWAETGFLWTSPAAPTISTTLTNLTGPPVGKRISWTNNVAYSEYQTVVVGYKDGVDQGAIAVVAAGVTSFDHTTASAIPYTVSNKWKYYVYARTSSGTLLYSGGSAWTEETPGTTTPPLAPTGLIPSGYSIDPTLTQPLTWTFNPGQVGDTQTQYQVRHRLVGSGTWTTVGPTVSTTSSHTLPANTYLDGQSVEWQVSTKGADPTFSPWSASATFTLTVTPLEPEAVKLPMLMDVGTGDIEASSTAFEVRDMVNRAQHLQFSGIKSVDGATKAINWTGLIRILSHGSSETMWHGQRHHGIMSPYGWNLTHRSLNGNVATLTIDVAATGPNKARVGDEITVQSVGAPFDGVHTVLETTTNTISFAKTNANITQVASGGYVWVTIHGEAGAPDRVTISSRIGMNSWDTLWYELPIDWGSGGVARRNGVVAVTNKALTSNVATLTVVKPHYFAVNEYIIVDIGDPVFDGLALITGLTPTTVSYAKTNANVASQAASGIASPSGYDTMFGNFHVVSLYSHFVIPSNWIRIAYYDVTMGEIQWGDGERDTGWVGPASWGTGWTNYSDSNFNANSQILRRLNGVVHCQGLLARTSGTGAAMFTAPVGFRPRGSNPPIKLYPVYASGVLGRVDVYGSGLFNFAAGTATYVSINGITYPADL